MNSEGYNIPLGVDLKDSIPQLDAVINKLEAAKQGAADAQAELNKANNTIVSGAKEAHEAQTNASKSALEAKKASEERRKAEELLAKALEEKAKLEKELTDLEKKSTQETKNNTTAVQSQTVAVNASKRAIDALKIAVNSLLTGLFATGIALIAAYWDDIKRAITGVTKEMELQNKVRDNAIELYAREKAEIQALWIEVENENTTNSRKKEIIEELNKLSPEYFGNIKTEKQLHEEGLDAINKYVKALEIKARAQVAQDLYVEALKESMKYERQTLEESASDWAQWLARLLSATNQGTTALAVTAHSAAKNMKEAGEETSLAFKVMTDAIADMAELQESGVPKLDKTLSKYLDVIQNFIRQREDAELAAINNEADRQIRAEELRFQREKDAIAKRLLEFKGSAEERKRLTIEANKALEALEMQHLARIGAITLKSIEDQQKKIDEAQKIIDGLRKNTLDQDIKDIEAKYSQMADRISQGESLTAEVEKELIEAKEKEINDIRQKYALEAINEQEKIATARVSAMEIQGENEKEIARTKEAMKLQVLIDAAQDRLNVLKSFGLEENKVAIAQTEGLIGELNDRLKKVQSDNPVKQAGGLFSLFGLDVSPREERLVLNAWKRSLSNITNAFQEAVQLQINAKQKQIDALNSQINDVERELDRELRLQEQGYANNVDAKRRELEALQAEREKEIAAEEELQKRQQKIALAQVAINGIMQTSEMVSAAAKIFKAHSGIPFAGVAIAAAAVGTMIATFASIKNQVKAMQDAVPTFRKGGAFFLDGPNHESGGLGVYNEKTGQRVAEVEGGEGFFAINKKSTQKYRHILEAFNDDDLGRVGSLVDGLLSGTGVMISDKEQHKNIVMIANKGLDKEQEYKDAMIAWANSKSLESIAYTNKQLLLLEKGKTKVTETLDFRIEESGNIIRRIKKKK